MADKKLTDLTAYAGILDLADLVHIVDVSDTSQDPAGSSYKLTLTQLEALLNVRDYQLGGNAFGVTATFGTTDANDISFITSGTEKMRLTTGGLLGIGNTPTAVLQVSYPNDTPFLFNFYNQAYTAGGGNGYKMYQEAGGKIYFCQAGTEFMSVTTGHNVTLTGSNTTETLRVLGTDALNTSYAMYVRGSTSTKSFLFTNAGQLKIGDGSAVPTAAMEIGSYGTGLGTYSLKIKNSASEGTMYLTDNGRLELGATSTQSHTIFIGKNGTGAASTGDYNTIIGESAFEGTGAGHANTGVGQNVLSANTSGAKNCAIGVNALYANTTGDDNTAMGYTCLTSVAAIRNSAFGSSVLGNHVSGDHNVAMGWYALQTSTTCYESTAIGASSQNEGTTGNRNTSLGYGSLATNTTGSMNVALGHQAGLTNIGSSNVFIGFNAGYRQVAVSDKLLISNYNSASAAAELTDSLIYGVFNASPANQELHINAAHINMDDLPVGRASVSVGELFVDTAANVLANGDYVVARKV